MLTLSFSGWIPEQMSNLRIFSAQSVWGCGWLCFCPRRACCSCTRHHLLCFVVGNFPDFLQLVAVWWHDMLGWLGIFRLSVTNFSCRYTCKPWDVQCRCPLPFLSKKGLCEDNRMDRQVCVMCPQGIHTVNVVSGCVGETCGFGWRLRNKGSLMFYCLEQFNLAARTLRSVAIVLGKQFPFSAAECCVSTQDTIHHNANQLSLALGNKELFSLLMQLWYCLPSKIIFQKYNTAMCPNISQKDRNCRTHLRICRKLFTVVSPHANGLQKWTRLPISSSAEKS